MRILVHEFETGGGARDDGSAFSPPLAREGAAMRAALLTDLAALDRIEIAATADPRLGVSTPSRVRVLPPVNGVDTTFRCLVEHADAVWLIAPETDGILESLTATVEQAGRIVIGSSAAVIRRVSDKLRLARRLTACGIPVPPAADDALPAVIKPRHGAGCTGVHLARTRAEFIAAKAMVRAATNGGTRRQAEAGGLARARPAGVIAQAYVAGAPASVSLVSDGRRAIPLAVNAQHVRPGRPFTYHGGETPLRHPLAARAADRAVSACEAMPGLTGFVGVDVVLTEDDAVVIEINPRLTTAYVGLRHTLGANVAALILAASTGELPATAPAARAPVRFSVDGRVEFLASPAHPSIPAGGSGPYDPLSPESGRKREGEEGSLRES